MTLQDNHLKIAVITGVHPFDVPSFHALFLDMTGIDAYIQDLENFTHDWGKMRTEYDVLVFYNMHTNAPEEAVKKSLALLGETSQGIVVLHHAILAWPQWDLWTNLTGLQSRNFAYFNDQHINVTVADNTHPITACLNDFEIDDETYTMTEPDADSHVLLTTTHEPSMKSLAWTRQYKNARVFCLQLGHDQQAWANENFDLLLSRGIHWAAGK